MVVKVYKLTHFGLDLFGVPAREVGHAQRDVIFAGLVEIGPVVTELAGRVRGNVMLEGRP